MDDRTHYTSLYRHLAVNALEQLSQALLRTAPVVTNSDRELALHILGHYAFDLPEAWATTSKLLLYLAPKLEQAGYRDEWMIYLQRGIELSRATDDRATEAELAYQLGLLHQLRSKFGEARQWLKASIDGFASLSDTRGQAKSLNRLAYVACLQARYNEASALAEAALQLPGVDEYIQQFGYFIQGVIAQDQSELVTAEGHFRHSLALCEDLGDQRLIAQRLGSLGFVLYEQGKFADAIAHCERALNCFREIDDPVQQGVMRLNLGNIYLLTENYTIAEEMYYQAEMALERALDERNLTLLYMNRGVLHRKLRQWNKAEHLLETAAERWRQLSDVKWWANCLYEKGLVFFDQDLYESALSEFEKAATLLLALQDNPAYRLLYQTIDTHLQQAKARLT